MIKKPKSFLPGYYVLFWLIGSYTLFIPLWLDMMYKIPFVISLCIRVIKECAVLPIEIFIGYTLIKFMKRMLVRLERK